VDEIGLFPLPLALLPGERVPLHIFEERYRELIGECLVEERTFGLVLADDAGLSTVGTRAAVVEVLERFPDGRLNVVVEGTARFRLLELTSGRSFQTGRVAPVDDLDSEATDEERRAAAEALARVAQAAGGEPTPAGAGSFELAARVELEPRLKQQLLELRSERERLKLLERLLSEAAATLEAAEQRAAIASRNGHPHRSS
jgi:Lon protease-like protein